MTNCASLPKTLLVSALKVLHPGKRLSPGTTLGEVVTLLLSVRCSARRCTSVTSFYPQTSVKGRFACPHLEHKETAFERLSCFPSPHSRIGGAKHWQQACQPPKHWCLPRQWTSFPRCPVLGPRALASRWAWVGFCCPLVAEVVVLQV